jgi:hypothetical protein
VRAAPSAARSRQAPSGPFEATTQCANPGSLHSAVKVSVVIPCLNEAQSLALCIDKAFAAFEAADVCGEVVVSDNGSTDGSIQIAEEHGARVVHAEIKGYGSALRRGIEAASGDFIIMGDADDSYDFSEVPGFVARWREGYEVVMGNRFKGGIKPGAMPWHHEYVGNPVLSGLLRLLFGTDIGDSHCGMRGFTRDVYERMDLRTTGMEFASEFVIKAAKLGARMTEIPITLWPDKRGRASHLRSFRDGWRHLRFMALFAPNWLFLVPGALLAAVGMALVLWLLPGQRQVGKAVLDVHTMLFGMIFVLLGVQVSFIGLFVKVFSYTERFDRHPRSLERWLRRVTLEQGLVAGAVLAVIGLAGDVWVFWEWAASGFGPLNALRGVIFWSMWFFVGVQIVFSSFFLSMLGVSRGTYIGEYDLR